MSFLENPTRYRRLTMEGSWIIIGQIVTVLGALVLVRVLTEKLTPSQYGELALGLTIAGLVNQVVMGGVGNGISRFYSIAAEKNDLRGYLKASRRLMLYATLAVFIIGLNLIGILQITGHSQWLALAGTILILSIFNGYNSILSGIQNAARQRIVVAFHGGLDAWLKILLVFLILSLLGNSSTLVVVSYVLSSVIVTVSQFFFLRRLLYPKLTVQGEKRNWFLEIWSYSWPFSAWGIFTWMQISSDRWALGMFTSTQEIGLYAVLFQLGYTPISMLTGLATSFLGPILYQRSGDAMDRIRNADVRRLVWRITFCSLLLTLIGFLCALGLHVSIFRYLVAIEYRHVSYLLPWMVLAGGIFAAGQILSLKMMSDLKSKDLLWAKIGSSILGILFNLWGAYVAGVQGIIVALISFSVIYFIWVFTLSMRFLRTP